MDDFETKRREELVQEIKNAVSFLDAVFMIYEHNNSLYLRGPEITPDEIFGTFSASDFADGLRRSQALLSMSTEIGMAAYSYPGAKPYDEAMRLMKEDHPGFSDTCYAAVSGKGMVAMR